MALLELVCSEVRTSLLMDEDEELPLDQGFFELGLSSLLAAEVLTRLEQRLGRPIGTTALFNHPTVQRFSEHLGSTVLPDLFGPRA
ncbi:acyl carrier protein [Kitasatospora sp. RB6PN24]|uniref:acyl carrier protein n=1 Tax=Kitasatospora humi TaxID=2893891 RepID=UPI001E4663B4|nr:acyl carrier protein [Kitasatospora humi]MCC9306023.1 acyl carrier protein [Kitasatospora humi]